ncbi:MAG: hypothetical protein KC431_06800 [Myxococcales bacterium]|nr:hypothetical protein [Myxococcales bacterium]
MGTTSSGDDVDTTSTSTDTSTSSTTDTGGCAPGLTDCGGSCVDLMADTANCGMCGHECGAGCSAGVCDPALIDCVELQDPQQDCNVICGDVGMMCVTNGCDKGGTWTAYGFEQACLDDVAGAATSQPCTVVPGPGYSYIRCCCQ